MPPIVEFPPLELDEIAAFVRTVEHTPVPLWLQARSANWLIERLRSHSAAKRYAHTIGISTAVLFALLLWVGSRHRVSVAGVLASYLLSALLRQRLLRFLLPRLSRRIYLLPSIFFETGPAITEWTV